MGVLRLLGPDQSTLLFDFTAPTGSGNPNSLVTELSAGVDMGTVQPALRLSMMEAGAAIQGMELPPVEASWSFTASAATDDDLWAGLGQLARYLASITRDHPLYLEWNELGTAYYYDLLGATSLPQLFRGQTSGAVISGRRHSMGPVPISVMRQPWRRGATVTTSAEVVEGDPATGTPDQSRLASFTVTGDLATPCRLRAQLGSGGAVTAALFRLAHRYRGSRPSSFMTDYRDETAWLSCAASGRGWTITLGDDTTSVADGAGSASGNVAQVASAGSTVAQLKRRVRATRTTLMDSLRGSWAPALRFRATAASVWELQLRWGPSTADPAPYAEDTYTHDCTAGASFTGYVEPMMGRIDIPQVVALSGMAVEVWARRVSGTGSLNLNLIWLPPDPVVAVKSGAATALQLAGAGLVSPVASPAGGTAAPVDGTGRDPDDLTDNAGTPPEVWAAGRWRVTWVVSNFAGSAQNQRLVVRDHTGATDLYSETFSVPYPANKLRVTREVTAAGATTYSAQFDDPASTSLFWDAIDLEFLPTLLQNESIRTEPGPARYAVDKLDSSGNLSGYLEVEGPVPLMGMPGDNQVPIAAYDLPRVGFVENEHTLLRDLTVTVAFDPRSAL